MRKHPIWYLIIGIMILIIPTAIYLLILIPQLKEEYNILLASGGVVGGFGLYGTSQIPPKLKYSGLFKLASNTFTAVTVIFLVEKFIVKLLWLVVVFVISYIIFIMLKEAYKNGRRRKENAELAEEIARNITKNT